MAREEKSQARQRVEQKVRLDQLTGKLEMSAPAPGQPVAIKHKHLSRWHSVKKLAAWLLLFFILASVVLPAVGASSIEFLTPFAAFLGSANAWAYLVLVGLAVVVGLTVIVWSLLTIVRD